MGFRQALNHETIEKDCLRVGSEGAAQAIALRPGGSVVVARGRPTPDQQKELTQLLDRVERALASEIEIQRELATLVETAHRIRLLSKSTQSSEIQEWSNQTLAFQRRRPSTDEKARNLQVETERCDQHAAFLLGRETGFPEFRAEQFTTPAPERVADLCANAALCLYRLARRLKQALDESQMPAPSEALRPRGRPQELCPINGEKVTELRGGLTQPNMARRCGKMSVDTLQRAEKGEATDRTIAKLLRFASTKGHKLTFADLKKNTPQ